MQVTPPKQTFHAHYAFGPKDQQISKKNIIVNFINTTVVRLFKPLIFQGASFLKDRFIDSDRINQSKQMLVALGGEIVNLKTPDGDVIEGMHLSAEKFKALIGKYCNLVEKDNGDGTKKQIMVFKDVYCNLKSTNFKDNNFDYMKLNKEAQNIFNLLESLGIEMNDKEEEVQTDIRRPVIHLGSIPNDLPPH